MSRGGHYLAKATFKDVRSEMIARDYSPMRATNPHTGDLQEVILWDANLIQHKSQLAIEPSLELHVDLSRAFSQFNLNQRRVLARVLIQGQSMDKATRGLKKTSEYWRLWFVNTALPKLRKSLADYMENGKLVVE